MKAYCLVCRQNTDNVNLKMLKTKNGRLQLKSQCSICGNKKSRFVKEQEIEGVFSISFWFLVLGIRTPLPGLNILF